jgi:hypothetical protein
MVNAVVVPQWNAVAKVLEHQRDASMMKLERVVAGAVETEWIGESSTTRIASSTPTNPNIILHSAAPPLGRFTSAASLIAPGDVALSSPAFAAVLRQASIRTHCQNCWSKLRGRIVQCADCQSVRYCNRSCMQTDLVLHEIQCQALGSLTQLNHAPHDNSAMDNDLLRLGVAVLAMEILLQNPTVITELSVSSLLENERRQFKQWAKHILSHVFVPPPTTPTSSSTTTSKPAWLNEAHVSLIFHVLRFNAHPIVVELAPTSLGVGLFPDAAKVWSLCRVQSSVLSASKYSSIFMQLPSSLIIY